MEKKNIYQANLPIGSTKIMNVRKLHSSRFHNIYLLQYNAPPPSPVNSKLHIFSMRLPIRLLASWTLKPSLFPSIPLKPLYFITLH